VAPGLASAVTPFPWRQTLSGVQTLEAANVEEEVEHAQVCRRQPRHVADDVAEPVHTPALRCRRLDRGRHVVDAYGLPPSARELRGELAAAAAEIERTTEGGGALGLLAIQQRSDTCCRRCSIALPRRDPEPVHACVVRHELKLRVEDLEVTYGVAMMLPLLVKQDVEALENRVLASGVAGRFRGGSDLGEPGIRKVLERLTHLPLVVAPYRHDLRQAWRR
jgi:hypothetical protein